MTGIVFLRTSDRQGLSAFYQRELGCTVWLGQPDIDLLRAGGFVFGLAQSAEPPSLDALLCFVVPDRAAVDALYDRLRERAESPPRPNERYRIYHFYARDPEGRRFECQCFEHPLPPIS